MMSSLLHVLNMAWRWLQAIGLALAAFCSATTVLLLIFSLPEGIPVNVSVRSLAYGPIVAFSTYNAIFVGGGMAPRSQWRIAGHGIGGVVMMFVGAVGVWTLVNERAIEIPVWDCMWTATGWLLGMLSLRRLIKKQMGNTRP